MANTTPDSTPRPELLAAALAPAARLAEPAVVGYGPYGFVRGMSGTATRRIGLAVLLRFKWTMFAVFVLLGIPGGLAAWLLFVPEYDAGAVVEVSPIIPRLVYKTEENGQIPLYNQYLNTQVAIIRSATVLQRVLDRPDVQQTRWYRRPPALWWGPPLPPLERLLQDLSVASRKGTQVIDVKVTARVPTDAAVLANAIVDEYLGFVSKSLKDSGDFLYKTLERERSTLQGTIDGLEETVSQLRKGLGTGDPDKLLSERRTRLEELEARHESLRRDIALLEWELTRREAPSAEDVAAPATQPTERTAYDWDPEWRRLNQQLQEAQLAVELKAQRLGESNPVLLELRKNVELAEALRRAREAQLAERGGGLPNGALATSGAGDSPVLTVEALRVQRERLRYQDTLLVSDIQTHRTEVERTAETVDRLTKHGDELRRLREAYDSVRDRVTQRDIERQVPAAIRQRAEAIPPSRPSNEKRRIIVVLLAIAGAGVMAGSAGYLRASACQAVHELEDVPRTPEAPFLGYLPLARDPQRLTAHEGVMQAESIRMVRTAVLERLNGMRGAAVLVTSASAGAGKTTVALLLARSLAQCGKRVLLVDADLRNPSIAGRRGMASAPGLVDVLTQGATDAEAIRTDETPSLDVLPAGKHGQVHDPELLADGALATGLKRWRGLYDVIVLDTAPLLPVADTRILAAHVDGVIMTVREGHCRRSDVVDALTCCTAPGGKLLGTVFVSSHRARHYARYYSHYYTACGDATDAMDAQRESSV